MEGIGNSEGRRNTNKRIMKNTKLIHLLKTLSSRDLFRFGEYVRSPFFNKNKKVIQLCELLQKHAPGYFNDALEKQKVYQLIFGNTSYNDLQLNNVISDLLQLLYDFFSQTHFSQQKILQKEFLLKELLEKDTSLHFEKTVRRYRQLQKQNPYRSFGFFEKEKNLFVELDQYTQTKVKRQFDENLQLVNDNLDISYFISKFRVACEMISRNIVINANYQCHFLDEILTQYFEAKHLQKEPVLKIYHKALQMLQGIGEERFYFELKKMLDEHFSIFPKGEIITLYNYALNFSIQKINSGKDEFYQEILELYKVLLEKEIILHNNTLSQWTYKNIVTTAIRLKEFEWTEKFINEYKSILPHDEQNNAYAYNLAVWYHAQNDFRNALFQLQGVEFTDTIYHLGAKIIQLKCYYELNEEEAFYALVEAFKKYILRNKDLNDDKKKANDNFLKIAKKVFQIKIRQGRDFLQKKKNVETLLKELEPIANKGWLEECMVKING